MSVATALSRVMRGAGVACAALATALILATEAGAQGVTTGAVRGRITDTQGQPVPNATVLISSTESGTRYSTTTASNGSFYVANVLVGAYAIEARAIGFRAARRTDLVVTLGQASDMQLRLEPAAVELEGITVAGAGEDPELNPTRTGVSAFVSQNLVENLPSLNRSFNDFSRTSALVNATGGGNSIAGQADRYNSLQIDGGSNGDLFGLNASQGQPGGRNSSRPLSVEAVKEFQVLIAPYDVRQGGFTGGLINAVTRSGTNEFHGSIFGYYQDDALQGEDSVGNPAPEFNRSYYGFSVGGPVVKDKLHFFVSTEWRSEETPFTLRNISTSDTNNLGWTRNVGLSQRTAQRLRDYATQTLGFDPGGFLQPIIPNPDRNIFAKLSAQFGDGIQGELSYNNTTSTLQVLTHDPFGANPTRLREGYQFNDAGYDNSNTTHSIRARLNAQLNSRMTNEVIASVYKIDDAREMPSRVSLMIIGADSAGAHFAMGGERFSQLNTLLQDVIEVADNLTLTSRNHVFTIGGRFESFKFNNGFFPASLGAWYFPDTTRFFAGNPQRYERALPGVYADSVNGRVDGPIADFKFSQFGLYLQDQITAARGLTLTFGLRADYTAMPAPSYNQRLDTMNVVNGPRAGQDFGVRTDARPTDTWLFAPRFGFNYDVRGDRSLFLRGGAGIFSGRTPYVWASNAYTNTGLEQVQLTCDGAASTTSGVNDTVPVFTIDPNNQPTSCIGPPTTTALPRAGIVYFDQNFKLPQVMRFSLGADMALPWGMTGSVDLMYSKSKNQFLLEDVNLIEGGTSVGEGMRELYGTMTGSASTPRRAVTTVANDVLRQFNSSQDYSYSAKFALVKRFESLEFQAEYAYARSYDLISPTSDISNSLINFATLDGSMFNRNLTQSFFDIPHSVRLSGTAALPKGFQVSMFYTGNSGRPYAYRYNTDVNGDGFSGNDLFYVPLNATDISMQNPAQYAQLDAFINGEECLREQRGRIMRRNSCRNPWRSFVDARVAKTFRTFRTQTIDLTANIYNVLALMGVGGTIRETSFNENIAILNRTGYSTSLGRGIYSLQLPQRNVVQPTASRWKLEFGARYSF